MYKVSIPVMVNERFCKTKILEFLKQCGAQRIFLAIGVVSVNKKERRRMLGQLQEYISYFQSQGMEVGIWFWSFWRKDLDRKQAENYLMVNGDGCWRLDTDSEDIINEKDAGMKNIEKGSERISGFCCPASEGFIADTKSVVRELASTGADILLLDDDYRFGFYDAYAGCFCQWHMRMYEKKFGRQYGRKKLLADIYARKPNVMRSLSLEVWGESLEYFAQQVRSAADEVNTRIRIGLCSVMSLWDTDGTDSVKIAKILAGNTRPLLRLTGAPYWAVEKSWGNRLQHTIETERMEAAWCGNGNIEIMTEGDVFPRPRHRVPASFLEGFDTALRAAGVGDGILKYMLDYTSSTGYENGYRDLHRENSMLYLQLEKLFAGKEAVGVRIYESMKKFKDSDFTGVDDPEQYVQNQFFSVAARMLSDNTVPTVYSGHSCVGVAFGENARHLPADAFKEGLILDLSGAKILMEQGIDVGIRKIGKKIKADMLFYPAENEYIRSGYIGEMTHSLFLDRDAVAVTYAVNGENRYPDAFHYQNKNGQKFLVYAFDAGQLCEDRYRSYCMQRQLFASLEWLAQSPFPVKCQGNPDLYMICKQSAGGISIGLWNFFPDRIREPLVELDREYRRGDFVNCKGELKGRCIKLSAIQPYGFAFMELYI